jgi:hypothetical protein
LHQEEKKVKRFIPIRTGWLNGPPGSGPANNFYEQFGLFAAKFYQKFMITTFITVKNT